MPPFLLCLRRGAYKFVYYPTIGSFLLLNLHLRLDKTAARWYKMCYLSHRDHDVNFPNTRNSLKIPSEQVGCNWDYILMRRAHGQQRTRTASDDGGHPASGIVAPYTEELCLAFAFLTFSRCSVAQLGTEEIRRFLSYLIEEKKASPATVNVYNSAIRFLFAITLNGTLNSFLIVRTCASPLNQYAHFDSSSFTRP